MKLEKRARDGSTRLPDAERSGRVRHERLRAVAFHEAGHAVIAQREGWRLGPVTIVPRDYYTGRATMREPRWRFIEGVVTLAAKERPLRVAANVVKLALVAVTHEVRGRHLIGVQLAEAREELLREKALDTTAPVRRELRKLDGGVPRPQPPDAHAAGVPPGGRGRIAVSFLTKRRRGHDFDPR